MKFRKKSRNFLAAANQVIPVVGKFGEDFVSHLLGGEVVSSDELFAEVADVYVEEDKLAIQAKMSNIDHAPRPSARQIIKLHREVQDEIKFALDIRHGLYAFVFYVGVQPRRVNSRSKSRLLTRKVSINGKREIIARELQYVYLVDINLMKHLITSEDFIDIQRNGSCKISTERKIKLEEDRVFLFMKRTFLREFMNEKIHPRLTKALNHSIGSELWCIEEHRLQICFKAEEGIFEKLLPVRFIGSRKLGTIVSKRFKLYTQFDLCEGLSQTWKRI